MKSYYEPEYKVVTISYEDVISTSGDEEPINSTNHTPGKYDTPIIKIPL